MDYLAVYEWSILKWIMLGIVLIYAWLWLSGNEKFVNPDERFFKIEALDVYYESLGTILITIRNIVILLFLIVLFLIL